MKLVSKALFLLLLLIILLISVLSTVGIKTNKFNNLISRKASETKNVNLKLDTIKFKINPKELSLFLETQNPKIIYKEVFVPVDNIKVYIDFLSLFKSEVKIKKINLILDEIDITQLNKLSVIIKPSNFKSLLNNKVKDGKLISEIEIYLTEEGKLKNYIEKVFLKNENEIISKFNF